MERFEYKIINNEYFYSAWKSDRSRMCAELNTSQDELNKAGADGWEVISCVTTGASGTTMSLLYTLKRKLP